MKRIQLFISLIAIPFLPLIPLSAQNKNRFKGEPEIRESYSEKDKNHRFESLDDYMFNDENWNDWCYTLGGEFIGWYPIGIDCYAVEVESATNAKGGLKLPFMIHGIGPQRDSLRVEKTLREMREENISYKIGGKEVRFFTNYKSLKGKVELLTLDEVRQKYAPKVKGPVVYMINKFFIMHDAEFYKVDKDFIYKVEVVSSKDFDALKGVPEFTIIRIFTRTHHNWHQKHMG